MLKYPAYIVKDDDSYLVSFPDLENVITFGKSLDEALVNVEGALNGCLESDLNGILPSRNCHQTRARKVPDSGSVTYCIGNHVAQAAC